MPQSSTPSAWAPQNKAALPHMPALLLACLLSGSAALGHHANEGVPATRIWHRRRRSADDRYSTQCTCHGQAVCFRCDPR